MKCPSCGAWEERREVVCRQCGATYQEKDLLAFRRLEFLLAEMDIWVGRLPADQLQELRGPYAERLAALRARLIPEKPPLPAVEVAPPVAEAVPPAPRSRGRGGTPICPGSCCRATPQSRAGALR